jgi:hypothetical protein
MPERLHQGSEHGRQDLEAEKRSVDQRRQRRKSMVQQLKEF